MPIIPVDKEGTDNLAAALLLVALLLNPGTEDGHAIVERWKAMLADLKASDDYEERRTPTFRLD